jgi:Flp pilus assembly CpaE family ATPase
VCNRVPKDSGLLEQEHVESSLGTSIFMTLPDDWKTVGTSVNEGRPLAESAGKSKVRQAFMELAQRLYEPAGSNGRGDSGRANGEALGGSARRSGGLLEKFFG